MAIGLNDYTFQLNNSGVALNTDSMSFPYVDIDRVQGLDSAPYRETTRDHEGADGGFMDAEFEKGRDIILEGTVFANTSTFEAYMDTLKSNFAPVQTPIPFYVKAPGTVERLLYVKPRGVRYDWDAGRRLGMSPVQFLMFAEDPRQYDAVESSLNISYGGDAGLGFAFTQQIATADTYTRVTASGWGTPDTGGATTTVNGAAGDYSTNGTVGQISTNTLNVNRTVVYAEDIQDPDEIFDFTIPTTAATQPVNIRLWGRRVDANNNYWLQLSHDTGGFIDVQLGKTVGGVETTLQSVTNVISYSGGVFNRARLKITGSDIRGKVWLASGTQPDAWAVIATDGSVSAAGKTAISIRYNTGNTNTLPQVASFDNFQATSAWGFAFNLNFGGGANPGGGAVNNLGNRPTPVTFVITGPIVNPVISNNTSGHSMVFAITLGASDTLTVNTRDRTVYLNGSANRRNVMTNPDWFFLDPGGNFIGFGGQSGTGSTLQVTFRSAWR